MQQLLLLFAAVTAASPAPDACDVRHQPDADVAHVAEDDVEAWLDPATAELLAPQLPRIERRVGDDGVIVDVAIPEGLADGTVHCR